MCLKPDGQNLGETSLKATQVLVSGVFSTLLGADYCFVLKDSPKWALGGGAGEGLPGILEEINLCCIAQSWTLQGVKHRWPTNASKNASKHCGNQKCPAPSSKHPFWRWSLPVREPVGEACQVLTLPLTLGKLSAPLTWGTKCCVELSYGTPWFCCLSDSQATCVSLELTLAPSCKCMMP